VSIFSFFTDIAMEEAVGCGTEGAGAWRSTVMEWEVISTSDPCTESGESNPAALFFTAISTRAAIWVAW